MTQPLIGGKSQKSFVTGLEDFDLPFDPGSSGGSSGGSGSIGGSDRAPSAPMFSSEDSGSSDSGGSSIDFGKMQAMLQLAKTKADYQRMVNQARFLLPRTLEQIGGQYGTQGSYWSSGRREAQQEAAKKTSFDLKSAKADTEFAIQSQWLELAAQDQASQNARSG